MRIFRWVMLVFVGLLLAAVGMFWTLSYFRAYITYYNGDSLSAGASCAVGLAGVSVATEPRAFGSDVGFHYDSGEIEPGTHERVWREYKWGFGYPKFQPGMYTVVFPLWLPTVVLSGIETLIVWRMLRALRKKVAPAFPVAVNDAARSNETLK